MRAPPPLFTHAGRGPAATPPFQVKSSPWRLQFKAAWSGHLEIKALTTRGWGGSVVDQRVAAGVVYEAYIYDRSGNLCLSVGTSAPPDGEWTVWVIEVDADPRALAPSGSVR